MFCAVRCRCFWRSRFSSPPTASCPGWSSSRGRSGVLLDAQQHLLPHQDHLLQAQASGAKVLWMLVGVAIVDFMFFGKYLGVLSSTLSFEGGMQFAPAGAFLPTTAIVFHFAGADRKDLVGILQQYQAFTRHVQSGLGTLRIVQWDMSIRLLCFPESESKESFAGCGVPFRLSFRL